MCGIQWERQNLFFFLRSHPPCLSHPLDVLQANAPCRLARQLYALPRLNVKTYFDLAVTRPFQGAQNDWLISNIYDWSLREMVSWSVHIRATMNLNFACLAERFIQLKPSRDESPVNVPLEPDNSITVADVSLLAGRQAEVSVFCGYSYHSFTRYLCLFSRDASERYRGEFGRRRVRACQICANLTPIPRGRPYFVNPFNQIKEKPETSGETLLLSY